jgi:Protein of unknown function (DUF1559)
MIQLQCACGAKLQARAEHAGKAVKCPRCGQRVLLPGGAELTEESRRERVRPHDDRPPGPPPLPPRKDRYPDERYADERYADERYADEGRYGDEGRPRRQRFDDEPPPGPPLSGKALTAMIVGLSALMVVGLLAIPDLALALGVFTFILPALVALPALVFAFLGLRDLSRRRDLSGHGLGYSGLAMGGAALLSIGLLVLLQGGYKESQRRADADRKLAAEKRQSEMNLKQIGLAMHNYHDTHRIFPPAVVYSPKGEPLYSWRVLILPFIEEGQLYNEFHLDEPWDSAHNIRLVDRMPKIYALPGKANTKETHYQVFYSSGKKEPTGLFICDPKGLKPFELSPFGTGNARGGHQLARGQRDRGRIIDITDGTSNTFLAVEATEGIPWSKPGDLPYEPDLPLPKMGGHFPGGFHALLCDGSIRFIDEARHSPENLRRLIQPRDGLVIEFPEERPKW